MPKKVYRRKWSSRFGKWKAGLNKLRAEHKKKAAAIQIDYDRKKGTLEKDLKKAGKDLKKKRKAGLKTYRGLQRNWNRRTGKLKKQYRDLAKKARASKPGA